MYRNNHEQTSHDKHTETITSKQHKIRNKNNAVGDCMQMIKIKQNIRGGGNHWKTTNKNEAVSPLLTPLTTTTYTTNAVLGSNISLPPPSYKKRGGGGSYKIAPPCFFSAHVKSTLYQWKLLHAWLDMRHHLSASNSLCLFLYFISITTSKLKTVLQLHHQSKYFHSYFNSIKHSAFYAQTVLHITASTLN